MQMPFFVLTIRMTEHGASTVCAVNADRVEKSEVSVRWMANDQVVYSVPPAQLVACEACDSQIAARALMRARQLDLRQKGRMGAEFVGLRPAVGGIHQVGHVLETVIAAVEPSHYIHQRLARNNK
ncbi:MAG: hypothetical protein EXR77_00470 [Myxococcales bacterium]|nr:hypothetical protein [Myxococcales bacterium]